MIPQSGEIIQKSNTHPMTLRPLFLAIFAGRKIYSHRNISVMIIIDIDVIIITIIELDSLVI